MDCGRVGGGLPYHPAVGAGARPDVSKCERTCITGAVPGLLTGVLLMGEIRPGGPARPFQRGVVLDPQRQPLLVDAWTERHGNGSRQYIRSGSKPVAGRYRRNLG